MSTAFKTLGFIVILVLVVTMAALFKSYNENSQLRLSLERMNVHATELEQRIVELEQQNHQLKSRTVEGIVNSTSESLVDQWSNIARHFAEEMEKLGEMLEEEIELQETPDSDDPSDPI